MQGKDYSMARVASEFGIGKSTIFDIVKQKDKLKTYIVERESDDGRARKKMRSLRIWINLFIYGSIKSEL